MHPKTAIRPERAAIKRILDQGWWGQLKIHGHRAQIHIPDSDHPILAYNRNGNLHKKKLPPKIDAELRRLFPPLEGWNVIDAEWLKKDDRIFVFDFLKRNGELLNRLAYAERWELLPRVYKSPHIQTLPVLRTIEKCMAALETADASIEGLILRSKSTPGFSDTSIIRCRKYGVGYEP